MFTVRAKMIAVGLLGAAAIVPVDSAKADQRGHASWYSLPANKTANGERMNPNDLTAAHRSLPFGTRVLVENLSNGQSVVVRINDRGPFTGGRIIDLSKAAAASIGMIASGVANVRVSVAEGGVLAELGESTAKENATSRITGDLIAVAQRDETPAVSAKMAGTDTNEAKAAPKPSGKTKIAAKTAKTKSSCRGFSCRNEEARSLADRQGCRQAVPAKRKRQGTRSVGCGHLRHSRRRARGIALFEPPDDRGLGRAQGSGSRGGKTLEPPNDRGVGRAQRNGTQGVQDLQPPHQRGIEDATPLPCPRHDAGIHEAGAAARAPRHGLAGLAPP